MIKQFKVQTVCVGETPGDYNVMGKDVAAKFWEEQVKTAAWYDAEKEHCIVIALDTKLKIKGFNLVSIGSLNEAVVHPREVFRPLVAIAAFGFVIMHNHPSGNNEPSMADKRITRGLKEASEIMKIDLVDHIIMGDKPFSFYEAGLL